jgi:hypothetical protein
VKIGFSADVIKFTSGPPGPAYQSDNWSWGSESRYNCRYCPETNLDRLVGDQVQCSIQHERAGIGFTRRGSADAKVGKPPLALAEFCGMQPVP